MTRMNWPKGKHIDVLHGTSIPDPYRWLEDPNAKETKEFVASQNELFSSYINASLKNKYKNALTNLYNYEKYFLILNFWFQFVKNWCSI